MNMKKMIALLLLLPISFVLVSCQEPVIPSENPSVSVVTENIWVMSSLDKISSYDTMTPKNKFKLDLVRNETESMQVLIQTKTNEKLTIERQNPVPGVSFEARNLVFFEKMEDVLVPCGEKVKPTAKVLKLWLTYKTAQDVVPGLYKEQILLKNKKVEYHLEIVLNIHDAVIPEVPSHPCVFGVDPRRLPLTGLNDEQRREYQKKVTDLLLDYRISPFICTWLQGMNTECFSSPYSWNDERSWTYLKDPRFTRIALPYHSLNDNELKAMLDRARAEGLLEKAYFYLLDEPTKMEQYEQIREKAARLHSFAPEAKVITTFYRGPEDGDRVDDLFALWDILDGATSIFCTGVWSLKGSEARSEQCRVKCKEGQEWWNYTCMGDKPGLAQNSSGIPNRAVMWRNWKEQPSGYLYWVVNAFSSMKPLRPRRELPEGDGILVYPGEPFGYDGVCVSIRLERWLDGQEDYELLDQYAAKHGREAALQLLQKVYKGPGNYTTNPNAVLAFKKLLVEGLDN